MGKFDGVLLVSDFDDTLRPYNQALVPEENIRAIEYFTENGGKFSIATGRDLRSVLHIKSLFPIHVPAVVSNGAAMYSKDRDEIIFESSLPSDCGGDILELMEKFPDVGVEIHRGFEIWSPRVNEGVLAHLGKIDASPVEAAVEDIPRPWTKFALFTREIRVESDLSRRVCDYIRNSFPGKYEPVVSGGIADVAAAGVTKASGVLKLVEMLGVSRENLYCAGDSWNDLPMLREAAEGFVPENAAEEIKNSGVTVVRPAELGALAHIVEILDTRYPS